MGDGYYKQKFDYMNLHGDIMFNLNALFGGYNSHRVYEIIPYLGAGFTHSYTKPRIHAFTMNAGLINRFRISNAVDINLELSATDWKESLTANMEASMIMMAFSVLLSA